MIGKGTFLPVNFPSMANPWNDNNFPLVINVVDNAVVADAYTPAFSTLHFHIAEGTWIFLKGIKMSED